MRRCSDARRDARPRAPTRASCWASAPSRWPAITCAQLGFEIVARNVRVGRLELDVIARRGRLIVFCEVRSRSSDRLMTPAQSIDPARSRACGRPRRSGCAPRRPGSMQVRFDVASVLFDVPEGRLNYLEGAF